MAIFNQELFRERLNTQIKKKGLTRQEFAEDIGYSYFTVQKWFSHKNPAVPELDKVFQICEYLECDVDYLLGRIDKKRHDIGVVCELTGLTEDNAEWLKNEHDITLNAKPITNEEYPGIVGYSTDDMNAIRYMKIVNCILPNVQLFEAIYDYCMGSETIEIYQEDGERSAGYSASIEEAKLSMGFSPITKEIILQAKLNRIRDSLNDIRKNVQKQRKQDM